MMSHTTITDLLPQSMCMVHCVCSCMSITLYTTTMVCVVHVVNYCYCGKQQLPIMLDNWNEMVHHYIKLAILRHLNSYYKLANHSMLIKYLKYTMCAWVGEGGSSIYMYTACKHHIVFTAT